jgi:hypothetical protein
MGVKSGRVNDYYALIFTGTLYHLPNSRTENVVVELANPLEPAGGVPVLL